jgi:dUTP pyrophosphatase
LIGFTRHDTYVIIIQLLHDDAREPQRATEGSAGYDLFAYLTARTVTCSDGQRTWTVEPDVREGSAVLRLEPGVMARVPLGFKARLPRGVEAQVRPRSGSSFKKGLHIPNAPGTVDSDYPDEWMVLIQNGGAGVLELAHGERFAQMVLAKYEVLAFQPGEVGVTTTRAGGFGSTGV